MTATIGWLSVLLAFTLAVAGTVAPALAGRGGSPRLLTVGGWWGRRHRSRGQHGKVSNKRR